MSDFGELSPSTERQMNVGQLVEITNVSMSSVYCSYRLLVGGLVFLREVHNPRLELSPYYKGVLSIAYQKMIMSSKLRSM